jgi:hypothetical protein
MPDYDYVCSNSHRKAVTHAPNALVVIHCEKCDQFMQRTEHEPNRNFDMEMLELAIEILKTWEHRTTGVDWLPSERMMNTAKPMMQLLERVLSSFDTMPFADHTKMFHLELDIARAVVGVRER